MDKEKQEHFLKMQKFETLMFAIDCIRSLRELTGDVSEEDFTNIIIRVYEESFAEGQQSILDKYINSMFHDMDEIEANQDKGD
jgi:hypothetical protein